MTDGMSPTDVRRLLEGYCLDIVQDTSLMATLTIGEADAEVSDASGTLPLDTVSGVGIDSGTVVSDIIGNVVTLNKVATVSGDQTLTFRRFRDLSDDWLVNTRNRQIIPVIEKATGRSLSGTARVVEYVSGLGTGVLALQNRPIVQIHAIQLINTTELPELFWEIETANIEVIAEEGLLKRRHIREAQYAHNRGFYIGNHNYKVDYTYGYSTVPADLKRAICMLTASFALGMLGSRTGGGSLSVQGHSRNYGARGKYHDARQELDAWSHSIIRRYVTGAGN